MKPALAVSAAGALAFAALAWAMASGGLQSVDDAVSHAVNASASDALTLLAHGFSFIGSIAALTAFTLTAVALFWQAGWRASSRRLIFVMAGALVVGNLLKLLFERARPEPYFGIAPPTYSFPSGHALYAACFCATIAYLLSVRTSYGAAVWAAAIALAGLIGLSRIYLGVHYPSDVLAGYLAAVAWLGLAAAADAKWGRRL